MLQKGMTSSGFCLLALTLDEVLLVVLFRLIHLSWLLVSLRVTFAYGASREKD